MLLHGFMEYLEIDRSLSSLAAALIVEATSRGAVREGVVTGTGPRPYRRLDCDGRALAYIRERPKKRGVRVDVSGLWQVPASSRLRTHGASGAASLWIRSPGDVAEAARYLWEAVELTRGGVAP